MNFVWIDAIKFADHAKALNLVEAKWPSLVIQDIEKQLKYPLDQSKEFTTEVVESWVKQYLDGELQPQLKSQPIPANQDEPVYVLVGKTFDEVVYDDSKDVFVEFYATWSVMIFYYLLSFLNNFLRCGHCKRLAPIWESLGSKYLSIRDRLVMYVFLKFFPWMQSHCPVCSANFDAQRMIFLRRFLSVSPVSRLSNSKLRALVTSSIMRVTVHLKAW
jgi:protein disulfide-isomerase A1